MGFDGCQVMYRVCCGRLCYRLVFGKVSGVRNQDLNPEEQVGFC